MYNINRTIAGILFLSITSCNYPLDVRDLSFDAVAQSTSLIINEDAVFEFAGNPDIITFYSGEPGHQYEYRDRISEPSTNVQLTFSTATTSATNGALSLLISNDFNGSFDGTGLASATWTDITNRAVLATGTTVVASGTISLTDFAEKSKPIYIAFKYQASANLVQRKWTITNFALNHVLPDNTYTIGNMTANSPSLGWRSVDISNAAVNWTSALVITGASIAGSAVDTEDWVIMGPIDLTRVLPDVGVQIKNVTDGMNNFPFHYTYTKSGEYNAVFLAANVNVRSQKEMTKSIHIIVQ